MTAVASRWTVPAMKARLAKDPVAVERALITLFHQQTATEQATHTTREDNAVGFTGVDAEILSSFAEQVLRNKGGYPVGRRLSPKQMALATRKIQKYAAQLLRLSGINPTTPKPEAVKVAAPVPALNWAAGVAVSEATQHAWNDRWAIAVPVIRQGATDTEISAEVSSHNQSSYGALRWRTYQMVSRTGDAVLVNVTEHLCD